MGADIHLYVEVKSGSNWQHHDWRQPYQVGTYEDGEPKYNWEAYFEDPLYLGRNYELFSLLADVRNYHGIRPITEPRGLPPDVTRSVQKESNALGVDGHSHSWLLLAELLAVDLSTQVKLSGWVDEHQFKGYLENGSPPGYCGDVFGSKVRKVSRAEMAQIVSGQTPREEGAWYYARISWQEPLKDLLGERWQGALAALLKLGSPMDVRIVFWFDN